MNTKLCITIFTVMLYCSAAQAYLTQVENATSGTIKVRINLAKCKSIDLGEIKTGRTSKIADTGACCFESISVIGTDGPIKGLESGTVAPWGTGWQCFQNIHFKCYEAKTDGRATHIGVSNRPLNK